MARVAWWEFITARPFIQKPRNWVIRDVSPDDTLLATRRFLKGTQNAHELR